MGWVLAGGYGADMGGTADGISLLEERDDGALELVGTAAVCDSPSWLVRSGDVVYAALEGADRVEAFRLGGVGGSGGAGGAGAAGAADAPTLTPLGGASSGGRGPCHLSVGHGLVVVSDYGDGAVAVLRTDASGAFVGAPHVIEGVGAGPHPEQGRPHAHASTFLDGTAPGAPTPMESTLLTLDLGGDLLHLHDVTVDGVVRRESVDVQVADGPRDVLVLADGTVIVSMQLSCVLVAYRYTGRTLVEVARDRVPGAQPGDFAAGLDVDGRGRVHVGLRGSDRIGALHYGDGRFTDAGWVPAGVAWPRHLVVAGRTLHVAGQRSGTIASFELGEGAPRPVAEPSPAPTPTFLLPLR